MTRILRLSFIVCTYNGAKRLPTTLGALIAACQNRDDCEILVIDNASSDETSVVANEILSKSSVRSQVLYEPEPGKANALRLGFREAEGELFSIIDDDNLVDRMWVENVLKLFDSRHDIGLVAPRIVADFPEGAVPERFFADPLWAAMLGIRDLGINPIEGKDPIGAGMTGRTHVMRWLYEHAGTYLSDRVGDKLTSGEDHEKVHLFKYLGWKSHYFPELELHHVIPGHRLNQSYIDNVFYATAGAHYWMVALLDKRVHRTKTLLMAIIDLIRTIRYLILPSFGLLSPRMRKRSAKHWRRYYWFRLLGGIELIKRSYKAQQIFIRVQNAPDNVRPDGVSAILKH